MSQANSSLKFKLNLFITPENITFSWICSKFIYFHSGLSNELLYVIVIFVSDLHGYKELHCKLKDLEDEDEYDGGDEEEEEEEQEGQLQCNDEPKDDPMEALDVQDVPEEEEEAAAQLVDPEVKEKDDESSSSSEDEEGNEQGNT